MTIKNINELKGRKTKIDLAGPDGNAFVLLGIAKNILKQIGKDPKPIMDEMKSDDYENLINVFDREFGDYKEVKNVWIMVFKSNEFNTIHISQRSL